MHGGDTIMKRDGYITVEAAFVFPFVMLLTVLIIKFSMNLHDRVIGNILSFYAQDKQRQIGWGYLEEEVGMEIDDYYEIRSLTGEDYYTEPSQSSQLKNSSIVRLSDAAVNAGERIIND